MPLLQSSENCSMFVHSNVEGDVFTRTTTAAARNHIRELEPSDVERCIMHDVPRHIPHDITGAPMGKRARRNGGVPPGKHGP